MSAETFDSLPSQVQEAMTRRLESTSIMGRRRERESLIADALLHEGDGAYRSPDEVAQIIRKADHLATMEIAR